MIINHILAHCPRLHVQANFTHHHLIDRDHFLLSWMQSIELAGSFFSSLSNSEKNYHILMVKRINKTGFCSFTKTCVRVTLRRSSQPVFLPKAKPGTNCLQKKTPVQIMDQSKMAMGVKLNPVIGSKNNIISLQGRFLLLQNYLDRSFKSVEGKNLEC